MSETGKPTRRDRALFPNALSVHGIGPHVVASCTGIRVRRFETREEADQAAGGSWTCGSRCYRPVGHTVRYVA